MAVLARRIEENVFSSDLVIERPSQNLSNIAVGVIKLIFSLSIVLELASQI